MQEKNGNSEPGRAEATVALEFSATLPGLLRWASRKYRDRELFVLGERRISYAQSAQRSALMARGLLAMGIGKGTRVGILMENSPDWPLCFFAVSRTGALTVALSTFYQAPELSWAIQFNDIDTLIVSARYLETDFVERLERALPGLATSLSKELYLPEHPYLRRIVVWGECDRPWALKGGGALIHAAKMKPQIDDSLLRQIEENVVPADDLIVICTSGSTSEPKAVVHTHGVCIRACDEFSKYLPIDSHERTYTGQPFFWIGGLNVNLIPSLLRGAMMCFAPTPRPEDVLQVLEAERVTRVSMWPAQVHGLREKSAGYDLSRIRSGWTDPRDQNGNVIPNDRRMAGCMGMTESFGMHSIGKLYEMTPQGKGGHWGLPIPGVERKIVNPETGEKRAHGIEGELFIRGSSLMRTYYKKEREDVFARDGWFATGDLAIIDSEEYIFFTGRRGDMIKTSGANVAPREVERVLKSYDDIREAIVFGLPDRIRGEKVVAVVVPHAGRQLNVNSVETTMRRDISRYKVPAAFVVMSFEDIPRTGSQKPHIPKLKSIVEALLSQRVISEREST